MPVDVSGFSYFAPILAFLVVFVIMYAILARIKLFGDNASPWVLLFVSFLVATIFVSAAGVRDYVLTITPWFAALLISLFFMIFLLRFVGKDVAFLEKGSGVAAVLVLVIIFLVSGFIVFSDFLGPYLPGGASAQGLYSSRAVGALLLLVISALVSWVLVKKVKSD